MFKKIDISKLISVILFLLSAILVLYLYSNGYLNDIDLLREYINGFGIYSRIIYIVIQMSQAVFPFIPGGLGCIAAIILFGNIEGFFVNYLGICLGSYIAFFIGKKCGRPMIEKLFNRKAIDKFDNYLTDNDKFTKIFAFLVFIPGAPDDLLCYLAGTTQMTLTTFSLIILIGKIPSIYLYSTGFYYLIQKLIFKV